MTRTTKPVDATFYVQVEPEWYPYGRYEDDDRPLSGAKVVNITQKRPARPKSGTVLVKLTLRIPAAAFYPLRPEVVVVVPESMTEVTPIEVVVTDPHADGGES